MGTGITALRAGEDVLFIRWFFAVTILATAATGTGRRRATTRTGSGRARGAIFGRFVTGGRNVEPSQLLMVVSFRVVGGGTSGLTAALRVI